jgi:hypothetical protein
LSPFIVLAIARYQGHRRTPGGARAGAKGEQFAPPRPMLESQAATAVVGAIVRAFEHYNSHNATRLAAPEMSELLLMLECILRALRGEPVMV